MSDRIKELLETASTTLTALLLEEASVLDGSVAVDERAMELFREVGLRSTERAYNALDRLHEFRLKAEGYSIERAPVARFMAGYGEVQVRSPHLRQKGEKQGKWPLRELYGVHGGRCSALVLRWIVDFGLERPFQKASKAMVEHHGLDVGRTTVRLRTLETAKKMLHWQDATLEDAPGAEAGDEKPVLFIELDGCHLPVVEWLPAGCLSRPDHPRDKLLPKCGWTEARTGTARVAGEVTPLLVCRRDSYNELTLRLEGLVNEFGGGLDTQIVAIGDAGNGLKEPIERRFPDVVFILDRGHLKQYLHSVAEALGVDDREAWVKIVVALLAAGEVDLVLDGLEPLASAEVERNAGTDTINVVSNFRQHLTRFRDCAHYDAYEEKEWPIGSGEVEGAHRYLPQDRMKKVGQGGSANISTRCWAHALSEPTISGMTIGKSPPSSLIVHEPTLRELAGPLVARVGIERHPAWAPWSVVGPDHPAVLNLRALVAAAAGAANLLPTNHRSLRVG